MSLKDENFSWFLLKFLLTIFCDVAVFQGSLELRKRLQLSQVHDLRCSCLVIGDAPLVFPGNELGHQASQRGQEEGSGLGLLGRLNRPVSFLQDGD